MYGMADMFGRTYEYVNVVLFCYVEPVLTVLMILGALYALFRLPKAKHVAKTFMWMGIVVSALTGVLLIVSAIHAWGMVDMQNITQAEIDAVQASIMTPDQEPVIHDLLDHALADGYFQRQCRLQCNQSADIRASDAGFDHHLNLRLL